MSFLIGADPEFFVKYKGKPVAAVGLVPGTKDSPTPVTNGAVQVDGLALEININPASTFEEFNNNLISVMKDLKKMVGPEYTFDIVPYRQFDPEYYEGLPDEAKELGCDPDFNGQEGGKVNPSPNGEAGARSAAGHLHIGWGKDIPVDHPDHIEICCNLTKHLDLTVGLASMLIDPDDRRRSLYGKAGAFRPKHYGMEYRVPSNVWLRNKSYRKFIWNVLQTALKQMESGTANRYAPYYPMAVDMLNGTGQYGPDGEQSAYRMQHVRDYFRTTCPYIDIPAPFEGGR